MSAPHFPGSDLKKERNWRKKREKAEKMEDAEDVDVVEYAIDGNGQQGSEHNPVRLCVVRESSAGTLPQLVEFYFFTYTYIFIYLLINILKKCTAQEGRALPTKSTGTSVWPAALVLAKCVALHVTLAETRPTTHAATRQVHRGSQAHVCR
jgi:hypothetical protein